MAKSRRSRRSRMRGGQRTFDVQCTVGAEGAPQQDPGPKSGPAGEGQPKKSTGTYPAASERPDLGGVMAELKQKHEEKGARKIQKHFQTRKYNKNVASLQDAVKKSKDPDNLKPPPIASTGIPLPPPPPTKGGRTRRRKSHKRTAKRHRRRHNKKSRRR